MIKNTLKQTKFEDKTVKSTQLSLVPVGLYDFQIFPDHMREAWKRETYVRSQSSSSESAVKYLLSSEQRFKYPLPWENKVSQMPHPRANKDNQIPAPCPASPPPPPPAGMTLISALRGAVNQNFVI